MGARYCFYSLLIVFLLGCHNPPPATVVSSVVPLTDRGQQAEPPFIDRFDDRLDNIIAPGTEVEQIASGFEWSEGPEWIGSTDDGFLIFSDVPTNTVYRWSESGGTEVYLKPSGYTGEYFAGKEPGSNGLLLDPDGNLLLCQHGDRRIARMLAPLDEPAPEYATVVAFYEDKRLSSPNDLAFHRNGDLYFTDPPYGLPGGQAASSVKELDFQGVFRFGFADSTLTLLTDKLSRPNGITFTPDYSAAIVANSDPERPVWMKYELDSDGNFANGGEIFYDASQEKEDGGKGLPDGMAMHSSGALFATGPGGVFVLDESAEVLGVIRTGQATANCTLNDDESMLYITADSLILRMGLIR